MQQRNLALPSWFQELQALLRSYDEANHHTSGQLISQTINTVSEDQPDTIAALRHYMDQVDFSSSSEMYHFHKIIKIAYPLLPHKARAFDNLYVCTIFYLRQIINNTLSNLDKNSRKLLKEFEEKDLQEAQALMLMRIDPEIWAMVFEYLALADMLSFRLVCQKFYLSSNMNRDKLFPAEKPDYSKIKNHYEITTPGLLDFSPCGHYLAIVCRIDNRLLLMVYHTDTKQLLSEKDLTLYGKKNSNKNNFDSLEVKFSSDGLHLTVSLAPRYIRDKRIDLIFDVSEITDIKFITKKSGKIDYDSIKIGPYAPTDHEMKYLNAIQSQLDENKDDLFTPGFRVLATNFIKYSPCRKYIALPCDSQTKGDSTETSMIGVVIFNIHTHKLQLYSFTQKDYWLDMEFENCVTFNKQGDQLTIKTNNCIQLYRFFTQPRPDPVRFSAMPSAETPPKPPGP